MGPSCSWRRASREPFASHRSLLVDAVENLLAVVTVDVTLSTQKMGPSQR